MTLWGTLSWDLCVAKRWKKTELERIYTGFWQGPTIQVTRCADVATLRCGDELAGTPGSGCRARNHYSCEVVVFCYRENPGFSRKRTQRVCVELRTTTDVATGALIRACNSP